MPLDLCDPYLRDSDTIIYDDDKTEFIEKVMSVINAEDARLGASEYSRSRIVSKSLGIIVYPDCSFRIIGDDYVHVLKRGRYLLEETQECFSRKTHELYEKQVWGRFAKYLDFLDKKKAVSETSVSTDAHVAESLSQFDRKKGFWGRLFSLTKSIIKEG